MADPAVDHRADTGPGVITITKAGWFYIILTILLGFAAVNTANNLIYLIVAAFLSFMGISGFFGKRNLSALDVRIEFPDEIYANTGFPLKVTLLNRRRFLPAFLIRVHFLNHEVLFPFVDAKTYGVKYATITFPQRGHRRIGDIHVCSVFPFHFFVRCKKVTWAVETVVFPQLKPCELHAAHEREQPFRGERSIDKTGYEGEFISLRDYVKGDPLKHIHWKASAKTGRLKTKELSTLSRQPVIIDFDTIPIKNIEEKISCVSYLIVKLLRQNTPVGLTIQGISYTPFSRTDSERSQARKISMLTKLALYDRE
jgi:uncharacterized protein (DUF58 family)